MARARDLDLVTSAIIGDAIAVHRELGPGLLESTYEACLELLLLHRGFKVERQVLMPLTFRGTVLDCAFRVDMIVENEVILEFKSVTKLAPIHSTQMITYLRLSGCPIGLLMNFNERRLADGLRRVVLGYNPPEKAAAKATLKEDR